MTERCSIPCLPHSECSESGSISDGSCRGVSFTVAPYVSASRSWRVSLNDIDGATCSVWTNLSTEYRDDFSWLAYLGCRFLFDVAVLGPADIEELSISCAFLLGHLGIFPRALQTDLTKSKDSSEHRRWTRQTHKHTPSSGGRWAGWPSSLRIGRAKTGATFRSTICGWMAGARMLERQPHGVARILTAVAGHGFNGWRCQL